MMYVVRVWRNANWEDIGLYETKEEAWENASAVFPKTNSIQIFGADSYTLLKKSDEDGDN